MTLLTVLLVAGFVSLGRWQWHRGQAKEAVWAEYGKTTAPAHVTGDDLERVDRFAHVEVQGHFEPEHQFLLDNRSHAGRPGYEVLTPFVMDSGTRLLVNRGWVPFTGYRDRLPDVSLDDTTPRRIAGRIEELPAAGLASGRAPPATDSTWPKLTSFPTHEELEAALGSRLTRRLLLLDPQMPDGYVREWTPPGLPPSRHLSYAIQWWGFAVVLLVLYFGLNFRKVS
ncbi:MAG TPA: SURF1 family protein [Steroidobacteraceae bacterium]|nr:SURF1 family protein [Steroidobacteraceae bacterium]